MQCCTPACRAGWQDFSRQLAAAEQAVKAAEGGLAFSFVEGALIRAVREGWWVLLDEINLAPPEVSGPAMVWRVPVMAGW